MGSNPKVRRNIIIPQHTPAMRIALESLLGVHNEVAELVEELTLEGFSEKVTDHLASWAILHREFIAINSVGYKIVPTVEVFGSFAAGLAAIFLKEDG
jgi:hypothetical protein